MPRRIGLSCSFASRNASGDHSRHRISCARLARGLKWKDEDVAIPTSVTASRVITRYGLRRPQDGTARPRSASACSSGQKGCLTMDVRHAGGDELAIEQQDTTQVEQPLVSMTSRAADKLKEVI